MKLRAYAGHVCRFAIVFSTLLPGLASPQEFKNVVSLADVNGNNATDFGVLEFDPTIGQNTLRVLDGGDGSVINSLKYRAGNVRGSTTVADANGDMIPEFAALVEGNLTGLVKDVAAGTLIGSPRFNASYETIAFLSVGDAGGGAGPDVVVVGLRTDTGKVQAQVKDVSSGNLVGRFGFNRKYGPFAGTVLDDVGDSNAMDIAVLGINGSGRIKAQVKDAASGNLIKNVQFSKQYAPLFFASTPDASGNLTNLTVLGMNGSGEIRAQTKRASDGSLVSKVFFNKNYAPVALLGFVDSNGSGSSEIAVVGVKADGTVRAEIREITDGSKVNTMVFNSNYPPLDAIAVNGVAGTGRNEIAVLGERSDGVRRLQVRDLLTGNQVRLISLSDSGTSGGGEEPPPRPPPPYY